MTVHHRYVGRYERGCVCVCVCVSPPSPFSNCNIMADVQLKRPIQTFGRKVCPFGCAWRLSISVCPPCCWSLTHSLTLSLCVCVCTGAQKSAVAVAHVKTAPTVSIRQATGTSIKVNGVPIHLVEPEGLRLKVCSYIHMCVCL